MFHEPLTLFGYLAAVTRGLELVTGVIVLPQRQTALVANQAAEVDVLSGGRLRLGVGIGWNAVDYEALGEDFGTRVPGSRSR
jgi:alkanesulfonate monooxygenase SsuD/methylene tetrahydromethanopterin reductase-like flavin-dependent oxidoreductase (luciferase family)